MLLQDQRASTQNMLPSSLLATYMSYQLVSNLENIDESGKEQGDEHNKNDNKNTEHLKSTFSLGTKERIFILGYVCIFCFLLWNAT